MKSWQNTIGIIVAGPLGLWMFDLYPPVGPDSFLFNAILSITLCALAYTFSKSECVKINSTIRFGKFLLVLSIIFLLTYAVTYTLSVEKITQKNEDSYNEVRVAFGFQLKNPKDQGYTRTEILKHYGSVDAAWTKQSTTMVRLVLLLSYNFAFPLMVAGLTLTNRENKNIE